MNDFLEQNLEEIIFNNKEIIHERGLPKMYKNTIRQFRLPSGKIMDIFSFEIRNNAIWIRIFELKKDVVDDSTIVQAIGYMNEIKSLLSWGIRIIDASIVLIGRCANKMVLPNVLFGKELNILVYSYGYDIDGIKFKENDDVINEYKTSDYYKYALMAMQYDIVPQSNSFFNDYLAYKKDFLNSDLVLKICCGLHKPISEVLAILGDIKEKEIEKKETIVIDKS